VANSGIASGIARVFGSEINSGIIEAGSKLISPSAIGEVAFGNGEIAPSGADAISAKAGEEIWLAKRRSNIAIVAPITHNSAVLAIS